MLEFIEASLNLQSISDSEDDLLDGMAALLLNQFKLESVHIIMQEGKQMVCRASTSTRDIAGRASQPLGKGVTGEVAKSGKSVVLRPDLPRIPEGMNFPGIQRGDEFVCVYVCAKQPPAETMVIIAYGSSDWNPRQKEIELIETLADLILKFALGYRQAFRIGNKDRTLGALSEVANTISKSPYLEEILQLLVNMTAKQFGYHVCTVRLLDEARQQLVLRATQATVPEYKRKASIKMGESIAGRAVMLQKTQLVEDVRDEQDYIGHDLAIQQGLRSMACVPLIVRERAIGVLTCYTDSVREFKESEIIALETIANQAAFSIESAQLQVRHTLMQEMHHRVKNNLQQIVSLLRLQQNYKDSRPLSSVMADTITRIQAIAAVHDLLSKDDLDRVGIRTIADSLVGHFKHALLTHNQIIKFDVRGSDLRLSMTQATQTALMVNELIQNALEHGFSEGRSGEIHVTIDDNHEHLTLFVANNGVSLPEGFSPKDAQNLGLKLVNMFATELRGSFEMYDSQGWTIAKIEFPTETSD